ncbi:serine/threonine protein kinase [Leptothoe kymatousa]|uniref:Serine/threonine protein kinase n=1 Tax=Leptothoe kymatousa TAU-MAC 1615 TaxID=2364775 RepID=A0ABS5Y6U6_9CYAN|nr:serine/threonine-protein kinase [Leptothoe kymatousa]MBT9312685.1 serine/threonine protein kinase [Leptothoe kymatousa TAU-MAC 1615]
MNQQILNNRYQLQTRLSKKGARHTYIAKDLTTHQPVIVKVLLFGPEFQWQDHKLFERGAASLKTLSFPGIPQYLDYFDTELDNHKGFAQVQSYIPAKSLQEQLQAGRSFSEDDLHQLALQLLKILDYLHQRQPTVIHRDIKPSNVLLSDRTGNHVGQVYLVDFDSVQTGATQSDHTMTIVGTYGYMPPEQFGGHASPASDLYSLGATLIYAATGKHPADLPQKDMRLEFASQVSLNQNLTNWLTWLTNPNLDRRPSSATQALETLENPGQLVPQASAAIQLPGRPANSNIMVSQTDHPKTLEVLIPPKGLPPGLLLLFILVGTPISVQTFKIILMIFAAFLSGNLIDGLILLVGLPAIAVVISIVILPFARRLLQQTKLHIDPDTITATYKFIGTRHRSASRSDVQLISKQTPKSATRTFTESTITIKTATHTFTLPAATQTERDWLIHTLSQWLQVPIEHIK